MEITKEMLAERYAAMTKAELMALPINKLTPMALKVYQQEVARRGISDAEHVAAKTALQDHKKEVQKGEKELKRKDRALFVKLIVGLGAMFTGWGLAHGYALESVILFAVVIAIVFLFRKTLEP